MKRKERRRPKLEPFTLPTINTVGGRELIRTVEALSHALHPESDGRYPEHNDEAFQEKFPRKGDGGYGSPGKF